MKIDTSDQQKKETNQQLNLVAAIDVDEIDQVHSNDVYHASLLSLSSLSVESSFST